MTHNTFLRTSKRDPSVNAWDVSAEKGDSFPGATYFARIMTLVDEGIGQRGLTFLATDDVQDIPIEGQDVVVFVHEDEWCRTPAYADRVRAVFKTYGSTYQWAANPADRFTARSVFSTIQDVRTEIARIPTSVRSAGGAGRIFDLPLGYFRQLDRTPTPINARHYDIYFGGTVRSQRAFKTPWISHIVPKSRSRLEMLTALQRMQTAHPEFTIESNVTQPYYDLPDAQVEHYSDTMLASKICLVPRGSNLETWRFFEGLRYGCAVVAERLPPRWYYDAAPIERLDSWDELESIAVRLLSDPKELERRHLETLAWWRDVCSEPAVARHIERCLFEITPSSQAAKFTVKRAV